jgi:hypothetical protein
VAEPAARSTRRSSPSTVPLPAAGTGQRGRERRERRRRRRRALGRLAAGTAAVAAVVGLGVGAWHVVPGLRGSGTAPGDAAVDADAGGAPALVAASGTAPRALLLQEDGEGRLVGATVLAAGGRAGGDVLFVPVGTMVEVPAYGLHPLSQAHAEGGADLVRSALENLLGVSFTAADVVGPRSVTAMVEPAGSVPVDLPDALERAGDDGRITVLFERGRNEVEPDDVAALLASRGGGSELDRLVRHEAFWRGWLAALADDPSATPDEDALGGVAEVVTSLARGTVRFSVLPVEAFSMGAGSADAIYRIRPDELAGVVARVLPESAAGRGARPRVQVLNGTGAPGLVQRVQPRVLEAGGVVTLTGNADRFTHERTQVVYYRDDQLAAARAVRDALGVGDVVRHTTGIAVVDVTVVAGRDLLDGRDERVGGGDDGTGSRQAPDADGGGSTAG